MLPAAFSEKRQNQHSATLCPTFESEVWMLLIGPIWTHEIPNAKGVRFALFFLCGSCAKVACTSDDGHPHGDLERFFSTSVQVFPQNPWSSPVALANPLMVHFAVFKHCSIAVWHKPLMLHKWGLAWRHLAVWVNRILGFKPAKVGGHNKWGCQRHFIISLDIATENRGRTQSTK